MHREQHERLIALAAQVVAEKDPERFHALLLELNQLLQETDLRRNATILPVVDRTHLKRP